MTLILKDKAMSNRDYENIKANVLRELRDIAFHGFTCWYTDYTNTAHFKINEQHRRVLEKHLYIID